MRIAILCTSNDTSEFVSRHNTDDVKYAEMIQPLRPEWQLDRYAVWLDDFPQVIEDYNGIIMTGSPASVHDKEPWIARLLDLIREFYARKIPMFGGCFGHQAIALALGGKVGYNSKGGWSIGSETTAYDEKAPYGLAGRDLTIWSVHKEEVTALPEGSWAIGTNDYCKYPAFVIGDHVLTSQYHPEMTESFLVDLTRELEELIPEEQLARARKDFQSGHQGGELIRAIITFFETAQPRA